MARTRRELSSALPRGWSRPCQPRGRPPLGPHHIVSRDGRVRSVRAAGSFRNSGGKPLRGTAVAVAAATDPADLVLRGLRLELRSVDLMAGRGEDSVISAANRMVVAEVDHYDRPARGFAALAEHRDARDEPEPLRLLRDPIVRSAGIHRPTSSVESRVPSSRVRKRLCSEFGTG